MPAFFRSTSASPKPPHSVYQSLDFTAPAHTNVYQSRFYANSGNYGSGGAFRRERIAFVPGAELSNAGIGTLSATPSASRRTDFRRILSPRPIRSTQTSAHSPLRYGIPEFFPLLDESPIEEGLTTEHPSSAIAVPVPENSAGTLLAADRRATLR